MNKVLTQLKAINKEKFLKMKRQRRYQSQEGSLNKEMRLQSLKIVLLNSFPKNNLKRSLENVNCGACPFS